MRRWHGNEWAVLITLSLGFFMTLLDLTIVTVAIPDMRRGLHASLAQTGWVINAYIIVLAVLMITAGRLGDLRGKRNLFITGVIIFTLASAAAGCSQTAAELIAARAVQGLGAALLLPQTMAVIIATFPAARRGTALGVWGGVAGLAAVAGPTIGGMLVTWLDWRWIFFVNLPVGVLTVLLACTVLPEIKTGRRQRLDPLGVVTASGALVAITYGLVEGQSDNWDIAIKATIGGGVVLLTLFLLVQARRQDRQPLLPFSLFRDRNYALMSGANMIVSVGLLGWALPITLYLQTVLDFSPLKAGLTMAPSALVSGFVAPFAGRFADRGGKYLLMCGFAGYAGGMALVMASAGPASHWYDLAPGFAVAGLGVGCTMSPMQTIATRNVDPRLAGAASGVLNTIRQTGSALGSAIVLAVLQNRLAAGHGYISAMRIAVAVPIGTLLIGACLCLAIASDNGGHDQGDPLDSPKHVGTGAGNAAADVRSGGRPLSPGTARLPCRAVRRPDRGGRSQAWGPAAGGRMRDGEGDTAAGQARIRYHLRGTRAGPRGGRACQPGGVRRRRGARAIRGLRRRWVVRAGLRRDGVALDRSRDPLRTRLASAAARRAPCLLGGGACGARRRRPVLPRNPARV